MGLRVIIPVAGVGSRLRPHTHTAPKVMLARAVGLPVEAPGAVRLTPDDHGVQARQQNGGEVHDAPSVLRVPSDRIRARNPP